MQLSTRDGCSAHSIGAGPVTSPLSNKAATPEAQSVDVAQHPEPTGPWLLGLFQAQGKQGSSKAIASLGLVYLVSMLGLPV